MSFMKKKLFHKRNISLISKALFIPFPIHMQIYVQYCVLRLFQIPGPLDCRFTNAEFQASSSKTGRCLYHTPFICLSEY